MLPSVPHNDIMSKGGLDLFYIRIYNVCSILVFQSASDTPHLIFISAQEISVDPWIRRVRTRHKLALFRLFTIIHPAWPRLKTGAPGLMHIFAWSHGYAASQTLRSSQVTERRSSGIRPRC
jgi:hypothetical protein